MRQELIKNSSFIRFINFRRDRLLLADKRFNNKQLNDNNQAGMVTVADLLSFCFYPFTVISALSRRFSYAQDNSGYTQSQKSLPLLYDRNLDPPFNSQQNTSFNNFRIKIITNKSFFEIRKNLIEKNTFDRRIAHPHTHA